MVPLTSPVTILAVLGYVSFLLVAFLLYKLIWIPYSWTRRFRRLGIPGEPFVPILGQLKDWLRAGKDIEKTGDFWAYEEELCKKHGPVFYYCRGPLCRVYFHDIEAFHSITSQESKLGKDPMFQSCMRMLMMDQSMLTVSHSKSKEQRKRYGRAFNHSNLEVMFQQMQECSMAALERWFDKEPDSCPEDGTTRLDIAEKMGEVALENIVFACFGVRVSQDEEMMHVASSILEMVHLCQNHIFSGAVFLPSSNWLLSRCHPVARNYRIKVQKFLKDLMVARTSKFNSGEKSRTTSIADIMADHARENLSEAISNGLFMTMAGHETTAATMAFAVFLLDKNPLWWDALRCEVFSVCGPDKLPTFAQAGKELPVCSAIALEVMRLFPAAGQLNRRVVDPVEIQCAGRRYKLPPGTSIGFSLKAAHRDARVWSNPNHFNPSRFLQDGMESSSSFLPFSEGSHSCLGRNFAKLEIKLVSTLSISNDRQELTALWCPQLLAMMAQQVQLKLSPEYRHCPMFAFTLRAKYGMPADIRRLTGKEVQYWVDKAATLTKEEHLESAKNLPLGLQIFPDVVHENPDKANKTEPFATPCPSKKNYGTKPPAPIRIVIFLAYGKLSMLGAFFMIRFFSGDSTTLSEMERPLTEFAALYFFDTAMALCWGWVSLQNVHLYHMWEHHFTTWLVLVALAVQFRQAVSSHSSSPFLREAILPIQVGFLAQLCECWACFRTFLNHPNATWCKLIQHSLGALLVLALSVSINYSVYLKRQLISCGVEFLIICLILFLSLFVQPSYVYGHTKALKKLIGFSGRI